MGKVMKSRHTKLYTIRQPVSTKQPGHRIAWAWERLTGQRRNFSEPWKCWRSALSLIPALRRLRHKDGHQLETLTKRTKYLPHVLQSPGINFQVHQHKQTSTSFARLRQEDYSKFKAILNLTIETLSQKLNKQGQEDGSWYQVWQLEFDPWNPNGRRELSPTSSKLSHNLHWHAVSWAHTQALNKCS